MATPTQAPTMGGREWTLLLVLAVLWGSSFFFFKVLVAALPPFTVVFARVALAALILNAWLATRGRTLSTTRRDWAAFALLGLLNSLVPFTLIAFGETRIASGLAAILNATTPIFTVLAAHWLTADERLTPARLAGIAIGLAGVALLVGPQVLASLGRGNLWGQAACLLAAASYAFAGIAARRFRHLDPLRLATGQVTAAAAMLAPLVLLIDRPWTLPMPGPAIWAALLGLAVLCTVIAYVLYFRLLATAGATNATLVTFLLPVTALLLGSAVLHEPLTASNLAGFALIVTGLAWIDGRLARRWAVGKARGAMPPP